MYPSDRRIITRIRENNEGLDKTFLYVYNDLGNLTQVSTYDFTLSTTPTGTPTVTAFGYTGDRLTSFNGTTVAYNSIGCPTGYDGKTAAWTRGKLTRLFSGTRVLGSHSYNYSYNAYGQRVSRNYIYTAGTGGTPLSYGQLTNAAHSYSYDHSGRFLAETVTSNFYGVGTSAFRPQYLLDLWQQRLCLPVSSCHMQLSPSCSHHPT